MFSFKITLFIKIIRYQELFLSIFTYMSIFKTVNTLGLS